jgi:hypothetical protein
MDATGWVLPDQTGTGIPRAVGMASTRGRDYPGWVITEDEDIRHGCDQLQEPGRQAPSARLMPLPVRDLRQYSTPALNVACERLAYYRIIRDAESFPKGAERPVLPAELQVGVSHDLTRCSVRH